MVPYVACFGAILPSLCLDDIKIAEWVTFWGKSCSLGYPYVLLELCLFVI